MAEPPVLDRLNTRLLETREVIRSFVRRTEVVDAAESSLELRTWAKRSTAMTRFPEGRDPAELAASAESASGVPGRLRIDLVSDSILRVRYAEGDEIPENATPMVVGRLPGPSASRLAREDDRILYETPTLRA